MQYFIYALKYQNQIFYIGSCKNLQDRITDHFKNIKNKKLNKIYNEYFENKEYELFNYEILNTLNIENKNKKRKVLDLEQKFINEYKINNLLLNKKNASKKIFECELCSYYKRGEWYYKRHLINSSYHKSLVKIFTSNIINEIIN